MNRNGRDAAAPAPSPPDAAFPSRIVCICGLAAEAGIARAAGFSALIGGGDRDRTATIALDAAAEATALVSFGIAGGLMPELRSGDVVVSTDVVSPSGRWRAEQSLRTRVADLAAMVDAVEGPMLGAAQIVASLTEKRKAWEETGAIAVDLESDIVARVATAAGIPFVVLRAIADPAHRALPPAALIALTAGGAPRYLPVLASLLLRPQQTAALWALARDSRKALTGLAGPARALRRLLTTT